MNFRRKQINHKHRRCRRKIRHLKYMDALEHKVRIAKHDPRGDELQVYLCPACRGYHVGHRPS